MRDLRLRIEAGDQIGPRVFNSGPYFGTAREGWDPDISADEIYAEVDHWVDQGARGFKAKGITPHHLQALIERAHHRGLTVTGHLDSGHRGSVNPRDAIDMGIDRVEHAFVLAGIPPAAALRFATINAARALGVDELGTIEVGKLADLVVVTGNPLEDIRSTRHPRLVMKDGQVYDPEELLRGVEGRLGPTGPEDLEDW